MKRGYFSQKIVEWYHEHHRDLPWRNTQEPYKIWLSEIILQQTRVIQGLPYYEKFIQQYPEINFLAKAKEEEVLRLWQGLGYYTRARNLHKCAREVVKKLNGKFPSRYSELKKLPGIGDYTAAAIASFAYHERVAVVDGNVQRVLSRIFGIEQNVSSAKGKKYFFDFANELMADQDPALFNQSIMEFGALQCIPRNPKCEECVFKKNCFANQHTQQALFPVKRKPAKTSRRNFYYFFIRKGEKIMMKRRAEKDIWNGLYDFPLHEENRPVPFDKIAKVFNAKYGLALKFKKNQFSKDYKHVLTHQIIHACFVQIEWPVNKKLFADKMIGKFKWYSSQQITQLPKPVLISHYLEDQAIL